MFAFIMTYLWKQLHNKNLLVYLFLYTTPFVFDKQWHNYFITNYGKEKSITSFLKKIKYRM